ncbi:MAG: HAD-IA family hydrolase [bacterium]
MKKIRAIIFDLDGTLIDSSDGVVEAVNYSLTKMGRPVQPAERIKAYIGFPLAVMYPDFTDAPLDELYEHFRVKAAETVVLSTVALPGADDALRTLYRRGFRLAVASTKIRPHIDGVVQKFSWSGLLGAWSGGDEVANVKPAPDIFHLTLDRLGIVASEAVVVGDTINDVQAAQAVPMKVVAVRSPYGSHDDLRASRPDYVLNSVAELPELMKSI